jgi:hypothetical protein
MWSGLATIEYRYRSSITRTAQPRSPPAANLRRSARRAQPGEGVDDFKVTPDGRSCEKSGGMTPLGD